MKQVAWRAACLVMLAAVLTGVPCAQAQVGKTEKYGDADPVVNFFLGDHSRASVRAKNLQQQIDYNCPLQPPPSGAAPLPPPARVTGAFAGQWSGRWQNDQGESGEDSLVLTEEPNGSLRGTWSGNLPVTGRRIDNHTAMLSGRTATRSYTIDARVEDGVLTLSYSASRLDAGGSYTGRSVLRPAK